jgi:hypothetical protein
MRPEPCNPKLATRALQKGLQNTGLAKALKIKPRRMPINAYVASRGAQPTGLTRAPPAAEDFAHGEHAGRQSVRIRPGAATDQARAAQRMNDETVTKGPAK